MAKKFLLFFIIFLLSSPFVRAQMADSVKIHIDSCLTILEKNSLYAKKIDWGKMRAEVHQKAVGSHSRAATFNSLKIAFDALGDKHANYWHFGQNYKLPNPELDIRFSDSIKSEWKKGPQIKQIMLGKIAYLRMPFMGGSKQEDIDRYANWLYDAVSNLAKNDPKGWIIDLRINGGGNIRPMMAGIAPFFEDGIVSYYIDKDNVASEPSAILNGEFLMDGKIQAIIKNKMRAGALSKSRVAVLIGPGTGSSGEGVAGILKKRKNTKLFGETSAGMANSTNGFVFANQECYFLISTSRLGDGMKKLLPESVVPDIPIKSNDAFNDLSNDTVVSAASKWLEK